MGTRSRFPYGLSEPCFEPRLAESRVLAGKQSAFTELYSVVAGLASGISVPDVRMVPGARIELATPAFSGRRSTNELPRLFNHLQPAEKLR